MMALCGWWIGGQIRVCSRLITILFLIVLLISRIFVVYLKEQANFLFELEMWIFIYIVFEK